MQLPWLDDLKTGLLKRFGLVAGAAVLGATAVAQAPGLYAERSLRSEAERLTREFRSLPPPPGRVQIEQWETQVPLAGIEESFRFSGQLRRLAQKAGCELGDVADKPLVDIADVPNLASVQVDFRVDGQYGGIQRFCQLLRLEPRAVAVTRCDLVPGEWPVLQANLTIQRYVRKPAAPATPAATPPAK